MPKAKKLIASIFKDERGASAIEYGLIAALIAAVIAISVTGIGEQIKVKFVEVCTSVGGTNCDPN